MLGAKGGRKMLFKMTGNGKALCGSRNSKRSAM